MLGWQDGKYSNPNELLYLPSRQLNRNKGYKYKK